MVTSTPASAPEGKERTASLRRWVPGVLNFLDAHAAQMVTQLSDLIRCPSVSGSDDENGIQADMAARFQELDLDVDHWQIPLAQTLAAPDFPGVEVDRHEAWGLVGALRGRGDGPSLMLNVHVDVVPPGSRDAWQADEPFAGTIDSQFVHGRGACDMKGGVVAALWAARALAELKVPLRGDLVLASVQGEEDGGLGTYATLARGWHADACIIPEPTSLDVVPANGGSLTFRLRVAGLGAHASRRASGVSAIEKFWPIFAALRRLESERNRITNALMSRWDIAYPIEVGRISGGDWASSVPDLVVAEGRYGVALGETPEHARAQFESAVADAARADPWLRKVPVAVEWWGGQFAPGQTDLAAAIITELRTAHSSVSTYEQQMWGAPYGSDLRLMTGIGGVPTVHYGPGDVTLAHGPREKVPIAEVLTAARTLAVVAMRQCAVG